MTKTESEELQDKKRLRRRHVALVTFTLIFLVIGCIWLIYWLIWGRFEEYTDDAYVNGNLVQLMSQIPGTVVAINTDDTFLVTEGQPLIKLDPTDMQIALEHAAASLAYTVRKIRQAFETEKQAEATLRLRQADLLKAQLDFKRRAGLLGNRAVSREELQHFKTAMENAEAQYQFAIHRLRAAEAIIQHSDLYHHPEVERAKDNYKKAYLNLIRTTVFAPVTGYVAKRTAQVGQRVALNTLLLAIVPLNTVWVDANYKESQLRGIRIGQPVDLRADAYSDVEYHGKVIGLNAGTGAAFSLLPPQNATGNWIKIVQRLPVRIGLDPEELKKHPLQIGLSMRVTTHLDVTSGPRLATHAQIKPIYVTTIYEAQLAEVGKRIEKILIDNSNGINLHG